MCAAAVDDELLYALHCSKFFVLARNCFKFFCVFPAFSCFLVHLCAFSLRFSSFCCLLYFLKDFYVFH